MSLEISYLYPETIAPLISSSISNQFRNLWDQLTDIPTTNLNPNLTVTLNNPVVQSSLAEEQENSQFKNAVLFFMVFAAAFLWINDWNINQAWNSTFGASEETSETITSQVQVPDLPDFPALPSTQSAPEVSGFSGETGLELSLTEYLAALKEKGYLNNELSSFSARQLYDSDVTIAYVDQLSETGFLEILSFVEISNYYQNDIPFDYLNELQQAEVFEKLSFVDISNFYQNDVSTEYLKTLDEAGYLDELSFVYISSFYENGVTVDFLDQLKEQGLYEDLNFLDIVDLYQRENGE